MIRFRDLLAVGLARLPWAQGEWGQRLIYGLGLLWDAGDEAASLAIRSAWIGPNQTDWTPESLEKLGEERRLPKYPAETWEQYATRLWNAWTDYETAGGHQCLARQLTYWGIADSSIEFHTGSITGHGVHTCGATPPWYSQFWIICSAYPSWANWGPPIAPGDQETGTVRCGISGATDEEIASLKALILKWKPSQWVCRSIIFEVDGNRAEIAIQPSLPSP